MKRIAVFILLVALSAACAIPAQAQRTTTAENMRRSRQAAKQQQKMMKRADKKQRKAIKKYEKARRKAARTSNRRYQR
jgi:hypothetical protein